MTYQSPLFYIVAILAVTALGAGFAISYQATISTPTASIARISNPTVLGAATGEPLVLPLAADTIESNAGLLPSQVNQVFLELCHRPARLIEIDQWTNQPLGALENAAPTLENCN
ncbi:MAG: hypothetical protein HZC01_02295 [Candidatus Kerfeldbacteria bacterium]|nr:hypothetical protein [Candidatus Kerfeldbacteria bacterium]